MVGRPSAQLEDPPNRIRALRVERGITLKAVADALGTTLTTVRGYETGSIKVRAEQLGDIARVLGVRAADLLNESAA